MDQSLPSLADATANHSGLAGFSHWTKNWILDNPIVEWMTFQPHNITATALAGVGAGAPVFTEINSSNTVSLHMDTDADSHAVLWRLPADMDVTKALNLYLFWSAPAAITAANTAQFAFTYKILTHESTTLAVAATAVDTAPAAQLGWGTNIPGYTDPAIIAAGKLESCTPGIDWLVIQFVLDLTTLASCDVYAGLAQYSRLYV